MDSLPPHVNKALVEFLEAEQANRKRGMTIEALTKKQDQLYKMVVAVFDHRSRDEADKKRYAGRIAKLEAEVSLIAARLKDVDDWHPDPSEVSGTHEFEAIQAAIKQKGPSPELQKLLEESERRREDSIWWKRKKREWAVAGVGALITLMLSGSGVVVWYLITHHG